MRVAVLAVHLVAVWTVLQPDLWALVCSAFVHLYTVPWGLLGQDAGMWYVMWYFCGGLSFLFLACCHYPSSYWSVLSFKKPAIQ